MIRSPLIPFALLLGAGGCAADVGEVASIERPVSQAANWRPVDADTGKIADVAGLEALSLAFPDSSSVKLRLLNAQLQAGEGGAVLETLRWLNERGYVFSEVARGQIPRLVGEEFAEDAQALLLGPATPVEASEVIWTLPAEAGLVEDVAVDEERGWAAFTSISSRKIWAIETDGIARIRDWAHGVPSGIALAPTNQFVFSFGNVIQSNDPELEAAGLNSMIPFDIVVSPKLMPELAPAGVVLSDLHIADDGTPFSSDPINGGVFQLRRGGGGIQALLDPGTFRSPQGLATNEDGKRLYVSDYRYGIAIIDLSTRKVSRLRADIPVILDGTDALFRRGNSLIAIQNGTSPMRISLFDLSDDGTRVVGHRILEMAHREWTEPLGGHLGSEALYYIGNGQWDKYVAGELGEGKVPEPTQVRRLPLAD